MRFKPGHVLYGSRRTYLRKIALADFEGITANTTYVLESKGPRVLLPELLPFIMQAEPFHEHSKRESKGSVNPYVNFSDLAWYKFSLPPLEEQRRIAEVLWANEAIRGVTWTNCSCSQEAQSLSPIRLSGFESLFQTEILRGTARLFDLPKSALRNASERHSVKSQNCASRNGELPMGNMGELTSVRYVITSEINMERVKLDETEGWIGTAKTAPIASTLIRSCESIDA